MNTLYKAILAVAAMLGLVFVWFFIKYNYMDKKAEPAVSSSDAKLPISASSSEEEKLKILAENFVRVYETYQFGDFTNLESLKNIMSSRLWSEKENFIKEKKQEAINTQKKYITFSSFVKKSSILSRSDSLIEIEVKYTKREMKGAIIQSKTTIDYVDENGQVEKSPVSFDTERIMILKLIKENNDWKINDILTK